jgi:hypothetical protein
LKNNHGYGHRLAIKKLSTSKALKLYKGIKASKYLGRYPITKKYNQYYERQTYKKHNLANKKKHESQKDENFHMWLAYHIVPHKETTHQEQVWATD